MADINEIIERALKVELKKIQTKKARTAEQLDTITPHLAISKLNLEFNELVQNHAGSGTQSYLDKMDVIIDKKNVLQKVLDKRQKLDTYRLICDELDLEGEESAVINHLQRINPMLSTRYATN